MGDIMSGVAKGWTVDQSLTCKRKLVQMYREMMYNRFPDTENRYTQKGQLAEEDGITLYSLVKKVFYKKNTVRLNNEYFTGECDIFQGEEITKADETVDIKCSWSLFTFPSFLDTTDKGYEYQGAVYMDLTGAKKHTVAYCLVNTPASLIMDEKRKLAYKYGILDSETEEYVDACKTLEKDSIFDMDLFRKQYPYFEFHTDLNEWKFDIPKEQRVYEIVTERNDKTLSDMRSRILQCRSWMDINLFKNK